MKQYVIKGNDENPSLVEILQKDSRGYTVKIKHQRRWGFKEEVHQMSEQLFQTCIRTGYFREVKAGNRVRYA